MALGFPTPLLACYLPREGLEKVRSAQSLWGIVNTCTIYFRERNGQPLGGS